ncbi:MAG: alanine--tRNA ligase [Cardiobacteriaceae bacterium]|nr:alanine--tRNA ligase [Cardiobacteriaceae bacterium]
MQKLTTSQIRQAFLDFFAGKGHRKVHSASLIPGTDPTLLFTNAGMVPFKDVFIGAEKRDYQRATSAQRCVRAGGKHNDLENVGYTARHHTFFEMLGNFSFGDYFKRDAIPYAWELLTQVFGLPVEKLLVTVYIDDDEAYDIWRNVVGLPAEKIIRIGDKKGKAKYESDNFWAMGDTGPCGPCSEIFYDHGEEIWGGVPGSAEEDGDRFIEIWNIVFMQFERDASGNMKPLPKPSIDTGMGLERIAAVLQGVHSNYEIDLFVNLIAACAEAVGCENAGQASLKVIADHIRSTVFLMADGVMPSNEGRGYVLRRIMRRAIRHGYKLGAKDAFFYKIVPALMREMGESYPEIREKEAEITAAIRREEERFAQTLSLGMEVLEKDLAALKGKEISGATVFKLYDTFGFPVDLTADIARERGLTLDMQGYEVEMQAQRDRAKAAGKFRADKQYQIDGKTEFCGYEQTSEQSEIRAIFVGENQVENANCGDDAVLVLAKTPFYGEMGGQVGDRGMISTADGEFQVTDTQKQGDNFLHFGKVIKGKITAHTVGNAQIDVARRRQIERHHSATHLLHKALRDRLGNTVHQKGSLVDEVKTRFDFSYNEALTAEDILAIENAVNAEIFANLPITIEEMSYDEAIAKGAMALFGEKYGDRVRVVAMGRNNYSVELCGGTHTKSTGEIGLFKIVGQAAVAAGVRRVECVTGEAFLAHFRNLDTQIKEIGGLVKGDIAQVVEKVANLQTQLKAAEKELANARRELALGNANEEPVAINGWQVLVLRRDGFDHNALREIAEQLRDKKKADLVVVGGADGAENAKLLVLVADSAVKNGLNAGDILKKLASELDGKGGGRANMAQGGGKNPAKLDTAFGKIAEFLPNKP